MAKAELRKSIFRVLSDLIKSDNVITIDEIDGLDETCKKFGITEQDREDSYKIPLGAAIDTLSRQSDRVKRSVLKAMEGIALKDGECCRAESLLITTMELICEDNPARVVSMEFKNRPLTTTQLLYIEDRKSIPGRSVLDSETGYKELRQIVKMGGLELIYIPKVAQHFRSYAKSHGGKHDDLKRVLKLVSPQSNDSDLENTIAAIQGMNSRNFYDFVLRQKLEINITIKEPTWILRLPDSVVSGTGYANCLCIAVQDDIKTQLQGFVDRLNSRLNAYSIIVNDGRGKENNFLYNGFYKALLDVMSVKKIDKWDLHIRLYGDGAELYRYRIGDGKESKCLMTIKQNNNEFPIPLSGREVAYYLLLICESIANGGVDFHDAAKADMLQQRYEQIYQSVSKRSGFNIPDVRISDARRPMKSYVCKAINESEISKHSALQGVYLPEELGKGILHVAVEPERVYLDSHSGSRPIKDTLLYKRLYK